MSDLSTMQRFLVNKATIRLLLAEKKADVAPSWLSVLKELRDREVLRSVMETEESK